MRGVLLCAMQLLFAVCVAAVSVKEYEQNLERRRKLDRPRIIDSDEEGFKTAAARALGERGAPLVADSDFDSTANEMYSKPIRKSEEDVPPADDIIEKSEKLSEMKRKLNEALDTNGDVKSLADRDMWKRLHDYLAQNFGDFLVDGHLGIEMHIRYFLCCYVVVFLPAQITFFVPARLFKWIPRSAYRAPVINEALQGLETFLKFARKKSETTFLVTFVVGRKSALKEDLRFILEIPKKIFSDPAFIVREFLAFEVRAEGYSEYKKSAAS